MKNLFIGIDVSKETIDVCAISRNEEDGSLDVLGFGKYENRPRGFQSMLRWAKRTLDNDLSEMIFCCETTGIYGDILCSYMVEHDIFLWREHSLNIKRSMGLQRGKNDKMDAQLIATYAARYCDQAVRFKGKNETYSELRALLKLRSRLVTDRKAYYVSFTERKRSTAKNDHTLSICQRIERKMVNELDEQIKACEKRMKEIIETTPELWSNYALLSSIVGLGFINISALLAYTENMTVFSDGRKLCTYYGVAPFREQSGTSINHRVAVNNYSNRLLKGYISEAADAARRYNPIYNKYYNRLMEKGKPRGVVLNNIKNKLLRLAFAVVRDQRPYDNELASRFTQAS